MATFWIKRTLHYIHFSDPEEGEQEGEFHKEIFCESENEIEIVLLLPKTHTLEEKMMKELLIEHLIWSPNDDVSLNEGMK